MFCSALAGDSAACKTSDDSAAGDEDRTTAFIGDAAAGEAPVTVSSHGRHSAVASSGTVDVPADSATVSADSACPSSFGSTTELRGGSVASGADAGGVSCGVAALVSAHRVSVSSWLADASADSATMSADSATVSAFVVVVVVRG